MNEFRWLPLRLNILPLIHKQVYQVLDLFLLTRADILEGDILALQGLQLIKQNVQQRIKSVDVFYVQRPLDPRMKYLYGIRTVLVQIMEGCNQFEESYQKYLKDSEEKLLVQPPSRMFSSPSDDIITPMSTPAVTLITPNISEASRFRKNQQSPAEKLKVLKSQEKFEPKVSSGGSKQDQMRLSDLKKVSKVSKSPTKLFEEPKKGTGRKVEKGPLAVIEQKSTQWKQTLKQKQQAALRWQRQQLNVKKSFRDLSDLVFTIKMTKQEYNQFMRLKRKNNHA